MPKIRDILVHVRVEEAQRERKCRRDTNYKISKGEMCLVIKTNPTNDDYSYSIEPAKAMLEPPVCTDINHHGAESMNHLLGYCASPVFAFAKIYGRWRGTRIAHVHVDLFRAPHMLDSF